MKIMVCGSIGYGDINEITQLYEKIKEKGFHIVDHFVQKDMDYSHIDDFRDKIDLCNSIVKHDLEYVNKADVLVVSVHSPSFGAAMDMLIAKQKGKKIILLAKDPVRTPWPINFSDFIVRSEEELYDLLSKIKEGY